ncbi:MAG: hypothetical protein R2838_21970 [Caldilineaceae bacterium]
MALGEPFTPETLLAEVRNDLRLPRSQRRRMAAGAFGLRPTAALHAYPQHQKLAARDGAMAAPRRARSRSSTACPSAPPPATAMDERHTSGKRAGRCRRGVVGGSASNLATARLRPLELVRHEDDGLRAWAHKSNKIVPLERGTPPVPTGGRRRVELAAARTGHYDTPS